MDSEPVRSPADQGQDKLDEEADTGRRIYVSTDSLVQRGIVTISQALLSAAKAVAGSEEASESRRAGKTRRVRMCVGDVDALSITGADYIQTAKFITTKFRTWNTKCWARRSSWNG